MNTITQILDPANHEEPQAHKAVWIFEALDGTEVGPLAAQIKAVLGVEPIVERLFPDDEAEYTDDGEEEAPDSNGVDSASLDPLKRFFRVSLPNVTTDDAAALFTIGYQLADEIPSRSCVPDIEPLAPPDDGEGAEFFWGKKKPDPPSNTEWALKNIRADKAWKVPPKQGGKSKGEGILIGQIDTGINDHRELNNSALVIRSGANFVEGGQARPIDNLARIPFTNPGHGIATASVIISRSDGKVTGTAPKAKLLPVRAIRSVVRLSQAPVAQGVNYARRRGCHVITMSLGGVHSSALQAAIRAAVRNNVLVMAAAGNKVGAVVYPARYHDCIAVGGSTQSNKAWSGASRGRHVDVSAPAQNVYRAHRIDDVSGRVAGINYTAPGDGTSFAVACTAGVAALWLAHFGRSRLIADLRRGETLQERFRRVLRRSVKNISRWDTRKYGTGIVDAEKLLKLNPFRSGGELAFTDEPTPADDEDGLEVARDIARMIAEQTGMPVDNLGMSDAERMRYATELSFHSVNLANQSAQHKGNGTETTLGKPATLSGELKGIASSRVSPALRTFFKNQGPASGSNGGSSYNGSGHGTNGHGINGNGSNGSGGTNLFLPRRGIQSIDRPQGRTESTFHMDVVRETKMEFGKSGRAPATEFAMASGEYLRTERASVGRTVRLGIESVIGTDDRKPVQALRDDPWRMICCLLIHANTSRGPVSGVGTGWFVGPRTIVTAGHCLHHSGMDGWADRIEIIPGRKGDDHPFGSVFSRQFSTTRRWHDHQDEGYDFGVIHLDDDALGNEVGWFGFGSLPEKELLECGVNVAGYPLDSVVNGDTMLRDDGDIVRVDERRIYYDADTNGGTSGAPVWIYPKEKSDTPVVVGIHAYGTGGTPGHYGILANSAPRILPEVFNQIMEWKNNPKG